jgi:magnesium transporter
MLTYYETKGDILTAISGITEGCWIQAVAPSEAEISYLEETFQIDHDFFPGALDEEEVSRIDHDQNNVLIILDYPVMEQLARTKKSKREHLSARRYFTLSMGIVLTKHHIITVNLHNNTILDTIPTSPQKGADTHQTLEFFFRILLAIAKTYLLYLRQIEKLSSQIEDHLHKYMKNEELIQLLELEKSLVYFSVSLQTSATVLDKIRTGRIMPLNDQEQEELDDVLIEIRQAIEMSNTYSNILSGTTDAFAGIISNKLNIVMKIMTIITIVISVPNIVFSFYGMNVDHLPYATTEFAIAIALLLALITSIVLLKSRVFK